MGACQLWQRTRIDISDLAQFSMFPRYAGSSLSLAPRYAKIKIEAASIKI